MTAPASPSEAFRAVPVDQLLDRLAASLLVRLVAAPAGPPAPAGPGPRAASWTLTLDGGTDAPPGLREYLRRRRAARRPARGRHRRGSRPRRGPARTTTDVEVVAALLGSAAAQLDRLVVLDVPPDRARVDQAAGWVAGLRRGEPVRLRDAAAYHPPLRVSDPLGGPAAPLRTVPASGHVAGVISRLDRERGAHHTPANSVLLDAVDLEQVLDEDEELAVYQAGLNLLRCAPGRGMQVWGGRTLVDPRDRGRFVAHRRLLHRLVRAIRRVAEPLVFDVNGPELRLTLVADRDLGAAGGLPGRSAEGRPAQPGLPGAVRRGEQPAGPGSRPGRLRDRGRPGDADGVHPPAVAAGPGGPAGGGRGVTMLEDPLPGYRFVITLDPGDAYLPPAQAQLVPLVAAGAFEEVSGLSAELEVVSYPEGGVNGYVHQLPLRHSWGRITLRRGVVRDPGLWSWYEAGLTQSLGARRSGVGARADARRAAGGGLELQGGPGRQVDRPRPAAPSRTRSRWSRSRSPTRASTRELLSAREEE